MDTLNLSIAIVSLLITLFREEVREFFFRKKE